MGERRKLDPTVNGLKYQNRIFMIAGYISDYELTYDEDIMKELGDVTSKKLTVADFKENKGYVDDEGYIFIFRENPSRKETIPWFTIIMNSEGKPALKFNQYRNEELRKAFRIERVGDLSMKRIIDESSPDDVLYDEQVLNDIMNATSKFIPEIKDEDDFLKKVIKTIILEKDVDVHKYKKLMKHSYELSNLLQSLTGKTKISPFVFLIWMELMGCHFKLTVQDNGSDKQNPLPFTVEYDSKRDAVLIHGKDDGNETVLRSAK